MIIEETMQCDYCGAECFEDELTEGQCQECIVEACRHRHTYHEYVASTSNRVRFVEHCIECKSWREIRFYFSGIEARAIGKWRSDEWGWLE